MGRRGKQRVKMVLPIKLWGRDLKGNPFSQLAHTLDINRSGARLGGLLNLVNLDDTLEVQYRHKKARFRVTWIGRPGTRKENQAGIQYLEPEKEIWGLDLSEDSVPDSFEGDEPIRVAGKPKPAPVHKQPAPVNKQREKEQERELRLYQRFPCSGRVEVRTSEKAGSGDWTVLDDISEGGCYVNTMNPLPVDARLNLLVRAGNVEFRTRAAVSCSHPGVGMALEFTEMTAADRRRLDELVNSLSGGRAEAAPDPSRAVTARIKLATRELREIEELLKSVELDPRVLHEFRIAIGHARQTAWAVQQWLELQGRQEDPYPMVAYLNSERIRIATFLCQNLATEIGAMEVNRSSTNFENLLRAVEGLFQRVAGFRFALDGGEKTAVTPPFQEPAHFHGPGETMPGETTPDKAGSDNRQARKERRRIRKHG